jgi:hypothetical protein
MQTFLPYSSFTESAQCLDRQRLGKQRIEAKQIVTCIISRLRAPDSIAPRGWSNHPAVRMWMHNPGSLCNYGMTICEEWISRGYVDNQLPWFQRTLDWINLIKPDLTKQPHWLGNNNFHLAHRSNLLRKNPSHYSQFFSTDTPDDLPYIWPLPTK